MTTAVGSNTLAATGNFQEPKAEERIPAFTEKLPHQK